MNEMTELLKTLATQLGTTTEMLWSILLKQAPISGAIDIVQYILIGIGIGCWWGITHKIATKIKDGSKDKENFIWVGVVWFVLIGLVVVAFFCLGNTVTAFINPEYWALDNILTKISTN